MRFKGRTLQLLPDPHRASYARARVEVQQRLAGELIVTYQGHVLLTEEAAPGTVSLRANNQKHDNKNNDTGRDKAPAGALSLPQRPAPDHPWRRSFKSRTRTKSLNS